MKFPFYKQVDSMDCGPACLLMISRFYGKSYRVQTLRDRTEIGKTGVNLLGISGAAESIGFRTQSLKVSFSLLKRRIPVPCILHWRQNHFVVLYKRKLNRFHIADPGVGLVECSEEEFRACWISDREENREEGIVLVLEPSPAFYAMGNDEGEKQNVGVAFKNIFNYILPYKKLVFQICLSFFLAAVFQFAIPFLTKSVVDIGVNSSNIGFLNVLLLAQLALLFGRLMVDLLRNWILLHISSRVNLSILSDFLIKLMKLPIAFFDSKKTGDILQRMNDHQRIESFLTGPSITVLFSLMNLVVFMFVLLAFDSTIFLVFVFGNVLYAIWVTLFLRKNRELDYKRFIVASKDQSTSIQLIQAMQEIKLNGIEKAMRWNWERMQVKLFHLNMKELGLRQWQQIGAFFVNEGRNIFVTYLSATAVINGQMTLGGMLAVQYIIGQLSSPIQQMISFIQSWQYAKISIDRLNEIHSIQDEEPLDQDLLQDLPPDFTKRFVGGGAGNLFERSQGDENRPHTMFAAGFDSLTNGQIGIDDFHRANEESSSLISQGAGLKICGVSFTYPGAGNEPVLKDIQLNIPLGKTTAVVGTSGSGKTTLLKLLLKFYPIEKGDIKLNSTSLGSISHRVWRRNCGVVMQESFIFSDTIASNISLNAEKHDKHMLEEAARIANIQDFVASLPLGFNTKIGAEGLSISTGQKQRILIARAVYRNPGFIFFDEATNSLDSNNERTITMNLDSFLKGRTVVVVAHRLSTVKNADQIVVLSNGVIVERGTHSELVARRGEYFRLVENQLELAN